MLQIGEGELIADGGPAQGGQGAGPCLPDGGNQVVALEGEHGLLGGTAKPAIRLDRVAGARQQLLQFGHRCADGAFSEGHG